MFEERPIDAIDENADHETELHALENIFHPLAAPTPVANRGFELPRSVWVAMLSCYAVFFAAIAAATGGSGRARFAILVSIIYTVIYFGVARIGANQAGREEPSPLNRGQGLQTWTGQMNAKSVYGQVLIVPFAIAFFGISILAVTAIIG